MTLADFIKKTSENNKLIAENQQKVFEAGKAQGSGGEEIEITTMVSNVVELSSILFANIPDNHLAFAFLIKPIVFNEYLNNQIINITKGFKGDYALRARNNVTASIKVDTAYDAAVTKGDVYMVLDLGVLLTAEKLHNIMQGLSATATGQTLTLPAYSTVKATYDDVYGEGAWDTIVATKSNWTIAYS